MKPEVTSFFHEDSNTICHVVREPAGEHCAIIDAVLDFDEAAGRTQTKFADRVAGFIREHSLEVDWILETHAHADHLSAARSPARAAPGGHLKLRCRPGCVRYCELRHRA